MISMKCMLWTWKKIIIALDIINLILLKKEKWFITNIGYFGFTIWPWRLINKIKMNIDRFLTLFLKVSNAHVTVSRVGRKRSNRTSHINSMICIFQITFKKLKKKNTGHKSYINVNQDICIYNPTLDWLLTFKKTRIYSFDKYLHRFCIKMSLQKELKWHCKKYWNFL